MKFYGVDTQGAFQIQSVATLPTWSASDERRWIYAEDTKKCYYGTDEQWVEFGVSNLATSLPGFLIRPKFEWKDDDEIYIGAGVYHHAGTIEQFVYWDSQLTFQWTVGGSSGFRYLYLDDSAIAADGTNVLTVSNFIMSTTEPTWSNSKHGWYNGLDRCIFAIYKASASTTKEFFHNSDLVMFSNPPTALSNTDIDTTWVDATLVIPSFATKAEIWMYGTYVDGGAIAYWRTDGSAASGYTVFEVTATMQHGYNTFEVITSPARMIEVKNSASNGSTIGIDTEGWYFPRGM